MAEGDFPKSDGDILFASEINKLQNLFALTTLNKIRQQQDRSVETSYQDDIFSDAYIDADGREDSVNTGNTTALYNSGLLTYANDNASATGSDESSGAVGSSVDANSTAYDLNCTANSDLYIKEI